MTRIRATVITAGVGLAMALSACGNGPPAGGGGGGGAGPVIGVAAPSGLGTATVNVTATSALQFSPSHTTAKVGQIVQWTVAQDSVPHNVTWDADASLNSPSSLGPGQSWQVKFTVRGTYTYHCTIHPGMDGQLTVGG